jgi:hypothetical protein
LRADRESLLAGVLAAILLAIAAKQQSASTSPGSPS